MKQKVLLGMSGGVDSSVAALLLKEQGYEVIGATMKLFEDNSTSIEDAKNVCEVLGISHEIIELQKEFQCQVINNFVKEYQRARTPNPCIECNQYLKFGAFYQRARELNCDFVATGHYARVEFSEKYQQFVLKKAKEEKKDQSYFLYRISKEILPHILFPLQNYNDKEEIREIANKNNLKVAKKKESQEICFIPDNKYQKFLQQYGKLSYPKGNIKLKTGEILGQHQGLINYTVGQRKGLGIAYQEPLYVLALDAKNNEVIVGSQGNLYQKELLAEEVNWLVTLHEPLKCKAKIRYRAKEADCMVYPEETKAKVTFTKEQRAVTPGQSVVFYDEEGVVLGGGKIC